MSFVGDVLLKIVTSAGEPVVHRTWEMKMGDSGFTFVTPAGVTHELGRDGTPAQLLDRAKELEPEAFRIYRMQNVVMTAEDKFASRVPLWLDITDAEPPAGPITSSAFNSTCDDRSDRYYPSQVIGEYSLSVNGEPWVVVVNDDSATALCRGAEHYLPHNLTTVWAHWCFCETASATSGYDSSQVGLLTKDIVAIFESPDDGPTIVRTKLRTKMEQDIKEWLGSSELLSQFRETWDPEPEGSDDFITEGFRALARSGRQSIDISGSLGEEDFFGVGRTTTSEWTFTCSLDPQVISEALGESTPAAIARYDDLVITQGRR